ncbi:MAG: phosphonate metabolism protein/1,5-bisphosphokinase (PRPP-forming) PhnN [Candidatus Lokiarchaeota archaeon]|nr:phosphonate metabolism protein/1,5-bisphosphokinase (PRPP-forming) PhnN [Candidatus Lokiarchaeota archaeon]
MTENKKNFPGMLILVVGNSGSGKDSIIKGVKERYHSEFKSLYLTQRYITRAASDTEDNITITPEKFKKMSTQGEFALEWHIYGLDYGVPIEIDGWLKKGHPVLVNVSRLIVKKAREIYQNILVVFIEVPFEITLKRVKERARESGVRLEERIQRAKQNQKFPDADFSVDNSGNLEDAINQFLNYLLTAVKGKGK